MTAGPTRAAPRARWLAAAVVCAALVAWARPDGSRARRALAAESFGEYLAQRALEPTTEPDPLRPLSTARLVVGRAASFLFAAVADDTVRIDERAGPVPRALDTAFAEPNALQPALATPVVLLGSDEAGLAEGLEAALAEALVSPVLSGAAHGQSPLGHIGLLERARYLRVAAVVSVWNLANDLGDTELLRRLHTHLEPGGPIDELLAALRDPSRAGAAQEAWFAERDDAAEAVVAVLGGAGSELERRARLHGARLVIVLLGLDAAAGAAPRTARMAEDLGRALAERGVSVVALGRGETLRDAQGRLTAQAVEQVVAGARAALE